MIPNFGWNIGMTGFFSFLIDDILEHSPAIILGTLDECVLIPTGT